MTDPDPRPIVECRHLSFGYGERLVLNDLTFTVPRGKVTALMGASGGGKTTVLRLIGGRVRPRPGPEPVAGLGPISLGRIAQLIRSRTDALGITSLIVSHDVEESFLTADPVIILASGKLAAQGTPAEVKASKDPLVDQFVHARADGPV